MSTTELIDFLKNNDVTADQLYNLLIADLYECDGITPESLDNPVAQQLICFYMYQIQAVISPVLHSLHASIKTS